MTGPSQPEFTSYDVPGATDMVDLATGDFSYRLPVLDIPGPERGFSLPLAYSAGIQLEQEASWVGLGWSLNPGAISRSVNGYPDDANAGQIATTFTKDINRGWTGGIPGIVDLGWNAISGHSGSVNYLGLQKYSWDDDGLSSVELLGIKFSGDGVKADPVQMATAAATIASFGTMPASAVGPAIGNQLATTVVGTAAQGRLGGAVGFNNQPIREVSNHPFSQDFWDYYNSNSTESAFGSLWFGNMSANSFGDPNPEGAFSSYNHLGPNIYPSAQSTVAARARMFKYQRVINQNVGGRNGNTIYETAADIYQDGENRIISNNIGRNYIYPDGSVYRDASRRPMSIAHDNFRVMGENVTGSIRPYRLDMGSIAYPKLGVNIRNLSGYTDYNAINHYKYMVVPFLPTDIYKPGFRYENSISNGYTYHKYQPANANEAVGFKINPAVTSNQTTSLVITDPRLDITANRTNLAIESPRKGLQNSVYLNTNESSMQLTHGRHVIWYSNYDIQKIIYATKQGFGGSPFLETERMDKPTNSDYGATFIYRYEFPPRGIGAFSVTAEDGTTYHYSLPVYQYRTNSEANEVRTATTIGTGLGKSTRRTGLPGTADWGLVGFSPVNGQSGAYATAWLLTAITSADYIDRNNSNTVDAADWGGWVKFEYGQFSSSYKWRQPYIGNSYSDEDPTITNEGFTEGYKETYYLNSISTRSHTALFVKSVRQDARGHFNRAVNAPQFSEDDRRAPSSSLRLDEIILLDNPTLSKLRTADGIRDNADPTPVPALTNSTGASFGPYSDDPVTGAGDNMNNVLDSHDLDGDNRIRKFIEANAIKRVRFNYSYDLCRGASNSFSCLRNDPSTLPPMDEAGSAVNRGGKLTLNSVSFFGPSIGNAPTKIIPDFVFGYENPQVSATATNPAYARDKWDAFGMYSSGGRHDVASHRPQRSDYPAPWTLHQITDPLGAKTEIRYERDDYARVSEFGTTRVRLASTGCSNTFNVTYDANLNSGLTSVLKQNQVIYLTGVVKLNGPDFTQNYVRVPATIASVSANQVTLTGSTNPVVQSGFPCANSLTSTFETVVENNVSGGDIRVSSITTKEGANSYQVRYKYTLPATPDNAGFNSSGVLSQEPHFLNRFDQSFYGVADYPATPVLYSRVSVLRGPFKSNSDDDYTQKEAYSFMMPSSGMVTDNNPYWEKATPYSSPSFDPFIPVSTADNQTIVDIGKIGQLKGVETYNRAGQREMATSFNYSSTIPNPEGLSYQGHYTEGLLNNERVAGEYRINRSTKEYLPTVMVGSVSTKNGLTSSTNNVLYDLYTGQVLETVFSNFLGKVYHTRIVPAYSLPGNEGMGPKGDALTNSHMLVQPGAAYSYMGTNGNSLNSPLDPLNTQTSKVLTSNVSTWRKDWNNYRETDASGIYQDVAGQTPVWRQAATYTWQSPTLNADGSLQDFTPFNWTGTSDTRWLKTSEAVRYDHYSHPLETRDVNGSYATQKTGYGQTQIIAAASNARYTELAYSGAEDQLTVSGATHFGGEVIAGGTPDKNLAHTGFFSNQLAGGQRGFQYRAVVGRDVDAGKTYRVSAWANVNAANGKLYASINGSRVAETSMTSPTTKKAGGWYLLTLLIPLSAASNGQTVEFGCANDGTAPANFDDFRVAPLRATVTSKVYDPRTNRLLYSLDNDNLFTHYEYKPTGQLRRVYQETLDRAGSSAPAERLVKEYDNNYAQLYYPSWISSVYRCQTDPSSGNNTGLEERYVVDVNPLNVPPTPGRWEPNGSSVACTPIICTNTTDETPVRLINNICERANLVNSRCIPATCTSGPGTMNEYTWQWPNGVGTFTTLSDCYGGNACLTFAQASQLRATRSSTPSTQLIKSAKPAAR